MDPCLLHSIYTKNYLLSVDTKMIFDIWSLILWANFILIFFSSLHIFICYTFIFHVEWKSKSDECEKVIDELKKQNSSVTATVAKLERQIKSKVRLP